MCESQSFYGGGLTLRPLCVIMRSLRSQDSEAFRSIQKHSEAFRSIQKHLTPYANDSQLQQLIENITNTRESTYIDIIHKYILLRYHGIHLFHHQP
jgi:hypothetical protein